MHMKHLTTACVGGLFAATYAFSQGTPAKPAKPKAPETAHAFATATLVSKSGSNTSGTAVISQSDKGIETTVSIQGATPGEHGIHIHEKGDCSSNDASSAGDHYNPAKLKHGAPHAMQSHIGDWGNISVTKTGAGSLTFVIARNEMKAWDNG